MFEFLAAPDFVKDLRNLDERIREDVVKKLKFLSKMGNPVVFARRLRGYKDIFRFRAGDYRIVFRLNKQKIILLFVKHRKDIYEGL